MFQGTFIYALFRQTCLARVYIQNVSDLNVTIVQLRDMNFMGKTTFVGSNSFVVRFARIKNFPFNFFVISKRNKRENIVNKGNCFGVRKTNEKAI